jgi:integrase
LNCLPTSDESLRTSPTRGPLHRFARTRPNWSRIFVLSGVKWRQVNHFAKTVETMRDISEIAGRQVGDGWQARAPATERAYRSDWEDFSRWCCDYGHKALPALPGTVCHYLADRARSLKYSTLRRRLSTISVAHMRAARPFDPRHPAIAEALQAIAQKPGTAPVRKRPLVLADLRAVVRRIPRDLAGLRDRTMLLLGFAGALRVAELCAVDVEHLQFPAQGVVLFIPRSNGDPVGAGECVAIPRGDTELCPVAAIEGWLAATRFTDGAVFRSIRRGHRSFGERLTPRSIERIVKKRVALADFDPAVFSTHSLRSGFIASLTERGLVVIMRGSQPVDVSNIRGSLDAARLFESPGRKSVKL